MRFALVRRAQKIISMRQNITEANIELKGCPVASAQRVFTYTGDSRGFAARPVPIGKPYRLPAYSISVIELTFPQSAQK